MPSRTIEAVLPPFHIRAEQDLGIRFRRELMALRVQTLPDLAEVVNLSIEDNPVLPVRGAHRLQSAIGEVQNREPTVSEGDADERVTVRTVSAPKSRVPKSVAATRGGDEPFTIGPAVRDGVGHLLQNERLHVVARAHDAGNSTHSQNWGRLIG